MELVPNAGNIKKEFSFVQQFLRFYSEIFQRLNRAILFS